MCIYRFHVTKDENNQIIDLPDLGNWKTNLYTRLRELTLQGFEVSKVEIVVNFDEERVALTWNLEKRSYGYYATCPENPNVDEPIDIR